MQDMAAGSGPDRTAARTSTARRHESTVPPGSTNSPLPGQGRRLENAWSDHHVRLGSTATTPSVR